LCYTEAMDILKILAIVVPSMLFLNALLNLVYDFLGKIKDKTESKADDKIWAILGKIVPILQKLVGLLGSIKR